MASTHVWEINSDPVCGGLHCAQICWWPKGLTEPQMCLPKYIDPNNLASPLVVPFQAAILFGLLGFLTTLFTGALVGILCWKFGSRFTCHFRRSTQQQTPERISVPTSGLRASFRRAAAAFGRVNVNRRQFPQAENIGMFGLSGIENC